jgi:hypothetical protein
LFGIIDNPYLVLPENRYSLMLVGYREAAGVLFENPTGKTQGNSYENDTK